MIICSCNVLSDGEVKECVGRATGSPRTPSEVYDCLGCSPKCGRCARTIRSIMETVWTAAHSACSESCGPDCTATLSANG